MRSYLACFETRDESDAVTELLIDTYGECCTCNVPVNMKSHLACFETREESETIIVLIVDAYGETHALQHFENTISRDDRCTSYLQDNAWSYHPIFKELHSFFLTLYCIENPIYVDKYREKVIMTRVFYMTVLMKIYDDACPLPLYRHYRFLPNVDWREKSWDW